MKNLLLAGVFLGATTFGALAQTATPPATTEGDTPAVATPDTTNPTAQVAGSNSFTEAQAKDRMTEAGYTEISGLKLDETGVWRATGMKDGKSVAVALDYQGNIVAN